MLYNEPATNTLRLMVDEIMDDWRSGSKPDAQAMLEKYPQLRDRHSLAIDLAYEEYCLREESGEAVDAKQFCNRFAHLRNSLARMLNMHRVLQSTSLGLPKPEATDWPVVGQNWCGWKLLEELGRGGFSRVYLAEEPALGNRRVVVKCSTSGPAEAFTLGKLEHPGIMPIHSIQHDEQRGLVGICMPFCGRATLAEAIDQLQSTGKPNLPASLSLQAAKANAKDKLAYSLTVARLMEKVARGLAAAHKAGVLHGDIKPSNIIQSFGDEPLLMDFNLSTDGEQGALRIGGTPPYMAPERLPKLASLDDAKKGEEDYRSDIFSLGVVFAELLYGQIPFEFEVEDLQVRYEAATPLASQLDLAGHAVPAELRNIVDRSIALNPDERFATATEMADALAAFIKQHERTQWLIRIGWIVCLVMLFFAGWGVAAGMMKRSPTHELLREAIEELDQGDFVAASDRLEKVQAKIPRREFLAWQGWCFANMKNLNSAKLCFEHAEPDADETGALWHNIGCCDLLRGSLEPAIDAFSKAISLDPSHRQTYWHRAIAQSRLEMVYGTAPASRTFEDIEFALEDDKAPAALFFDAARIYANGAKYSKEMHAPAERYIRKALEAGIAPEQFAGTTFQDFEIARLKPNPLPKRARGMEKIEMFRPVPFELRPILSATP
jgi:serine/threonine protein kinase